MVKSDDEVYACKLMITASIKEARFKLAELPPTRETSLVRTKLDEALLWLGEVSDQLPTCG